MMRLLLSALPTRPDISPQPPPVTYEAVALRFGILPAFPFPASSVFTRFPTTGNGQVAIR